jgi:NADH-quinone oxidoreductase subunit L
MLGLLWLIPAFPLAGFVLLALAGSRLSRRGVALVGVGSVGLSALAAFLVGGSFLLSPPAGGATTQTLWSWIDVVGFHAEIALRLDALSLIMVLVVTFVGSLIHLYSAEFMMDEEGYSRFFAYMNLFVGAMLILLLADNLLLLYLGWEGVGLCSYLLIGFWYRKPENGRAARKAFIVTRVGDAAMAVGLFLLFTQLGTLQIQELMQRASAQWQAGSGLAVAAAALLLGGAVGKSAQLPLQTWLPDAMAGPSPVSALIHAATMVTAGVYLIARTNVLFSLAPSVMLAVAIIGALTLLLAGFSALVQRDIKRVLAYSTISQIGYMFLALGVGAWSSAIFHFMTHAFFKALLFLGAGTIIISLHHEHDMFKMGGLRREMPTTFWTFLIGSASLAAIPLVTAGFYSKDQILWLAWSSSAGSPWLWAAGLIGALLTSLYTFRMVFLAFYGERHALVRELSPLPVLGIRIRLPLVVLAVLSVMGGLVDLPHTLGNLPFLSDFLHQVLPAAHVASEGLGTELLFQIIAGVVSLAGVYAAYLLILRRRRVVERWARSPLGSFLHRLWFAGWGFDWLYDTLLVRPYAWCAQANRHDIIDSFYETVVARPYRWLARINRDDAIDLVFTGLARLATALHDLLSRTQKGRVRWYAAAITLGAAIAIALVVLL